MAEIVAKSKFRAGGLVGVIVWDIVAAIIMAVVGVLLIFTGVLAIIGVLLLAGLVAFTIRSIFWDIIGYIRCGVKVTEEGVKGVDKNGKKFKLTYDKIESINVEKRFTIHTAVTKKNGKVKKKEYVVTNISNVEEVREAIEACKRKATNCDVVAEAEEVVAVEGTEAVEATETVEVTETVEAVESTEEPKAED